MLRPRSSASPARTMTVARVGALVPRANINVSPTQRITEVDAQEHSFDVPVEAFLKAARDKTVCCGTDPAAQAKIAADKAALEAKADKLEAECLAKGSLFGGAEACKKAAASLREEAARKGALLCTPEKLAKYPCVELTAQEKKLVSIAAQYQQWKLDWSAYKSEGISVVNNIDDYEKRLDSLRQDWIGAGGAPPPISAPKPKADEPLLGDFGKSIGSSAGTLLIIAGTIFTIGFAMPLFLNPHR